jgi:branched-chain amino acid transport system ATP-binding protein
MMLVLEQLNGYYDKVHVLKDVSLRVAPGEILGLLGRNGAGKTTTLKAIMGLVRSRSGSIQLEGRELTRLSPHEIPRRAENLQMGLLVRDKGPQTLDWVLNLFPALKELLRQRAGTLSGGQQQMLAMARALCLEPKLLLLDEPSEGLMPRLVEKLLESIVELKVHGVAVLLVEQKIEAALKVADRITFIENGSVRGEATPDDLAVNPQPLHRYVGVKR